jgi:cyclopropane-fatty-acyl-phospholipid synthase
MSKLELDTPQVPIARPSASITGARAPYRGASTRAIRHHYDISDDFYALWLDPTLTYSCADWHTDPRQTLLDAQRRKLDALARDTRAGGADRVLDIGCGWGALMRRLREHHDVSQVVGLTLSESQRRAVVAWADDRCEVRLENWSEHRPQSPYDAVISIEAFEHFAGVGMTRDARVNAYGEFFACCARWLRPGGRLAVQTSAKGANMRLDRHTARDLLFIAEHIFPESELPWPSEMVEAAERTFQLASVRNGSRDYVRTLGEWRARLAANRAAAQDVVGADVVADYERYLRAAQDAFANGHLSLMRMVFERI